MEPWAIQATYEGDPTTFRGTPCWLIRRPTILHRCLIGVETRKGRWVEKWVHEDTLTEFRPAEVPEPENTDHARALPFERYATKGQAEAAVTALVSARW